MKKEERLHHLFGHIDDDLVADAVRRTVAPKVWVPSVAAAAAVALTVGLAFAQPRTGEAPPLIDGGTPQQNTTTDQILSVTTTNGLYLTTTVPITGGTPTTAVDRPPEWFYEQKWEDKPIWMQFPAFDRNDTQHTIREITIDPTNIGDYLGGVSLHGYDVYTETAYTKAAKIYRIHGINDACAVALQYEGRSDYFPAVNSQYTPTTLGQFIHDLSLRKHLQVGTVYHSYRDENGALCDVKYSGLTVETVWELLLADDSLPNEYNWQTQWTNKISISIHMPLLGYTNISMQLAEDGYLRTNLLDTEKTFFIGKEAVAAFMKHLQEHCRVDETLIALPNATVSHSPTTTSSAPRHPVVTGTTAP